MNDHSELLSRTLAVVYPFILLIGLYLTINGHLTPGGGFQGGAVIAAIYISKYLVLPLQDTRIQAIQNLEKVTLFLIVLIPLFVLYMGYGRSLGLPPVVYLMGMNLLIGLKVASGMTIIFFRFVYYEVL